MLPIPTVAPVIIALLRESTGLIAISQRDDGKAQVYSAGGVPTGLSPPYTVLRALEASRQMEESAFDYRAWSLLLTLDTWSSYPGDQEINQMSSAIHDALNEQETAMNALLHGYKCTNCLFDTNMQLEDTSTSIRLQHGVERYRLRVEAL